VSECQKIKNGGLDQYGLNALEDPFLPQSEKRVNEKVKSKPL